MITQHPIVVIECPKCGKMSAARSRYLEPLKDENGNPDPERVLLMQIECLGCMEIMPRPLPDPLGQTRFDLSSFIGFVVLPTLVSLC